MTQIPNHNFPIRQIVVKDSYRYPKGSPEAIHVAYEEKIARYVTAVSKKVLKERKGWK